MDMALFIIGFLLFVGSLVYLVVSLIKKRFTKKKFIGALASGFALMIIGLSIPSSTETVSEPSQAEKEKEPELTPEQIAANEKSEADKKAKEEAEAKAEEEARKAEEVAKEVTEEIKEEPKVEPVVEQKKEPEMSLSQKNGIRQAEQYLDYTAFSKTGLIKQLEYEGYSTEEATFAVESIDVDWREQAVKQAKQYLDYTAFSRSGLIDQLIYEGHSEADATYAVDQIGL